MCAIVGWAGVPDALNETSLAGMRDTMSHRGPDSAGLWRSPDGRVVLGHRRLSILDLSPTGAQPMLAQDGELAIVFNGEIYNHAELRNELIAAGLSFTGRSDTEVLLAAYRVWREGCVKRLRGMFAFAIYDAGRRVLFLARDRAGEKPLYWARHRSGLVFSSELKALMADKAFHPRLSPQGLAFYLTYGYVPAEYCILGEVHKVRPGHHLTWSLDTDSIVTESYWDLPDPQPTGASSVDLLVDELQGLLKQSVQEQLMADVPVAVLLSGGLDSSIVTAVAASVSPTQLRTFTVSIPGHARFDESAHARKIAEHFGTEHTELALEQSSVDILDDLARQYDEPISDSSMIPTYLLARTVSRKCKVVLGGDGGDELFGGYRAYQGALLQERVRKLTPAPMRWAGSQVAKMVLPCGAPKRNGLIGLRGDLADGIAQNGVLFDEDEIAALCPWLSGRDMPLTPKHWRRDLVEPGRGMPGAVMATDFRSYMCEDVLVKVDRASMLCSLEVRAPLLDQRIVEFAYRSVPNDLRCTRIERKILLRHIARRLLPADFDVDRKQGFSIPLSAWLTPAVMARWREECRDQIRAILSEDVLGRMVAKINQGLYHRVFSLMMLTRWMRHYNVAV